jgi:hypothetical protein
MNLGNQPAEIYIEDVHLLVVPTSRVNIDPEDKQRAQAVKMERLANTELLRISQTETSANYCCLFLFYAESAERPSITANGFMGLTDSQNRQQPSGDGQKYPRSL